MKKILFISYLVFLTVLGSCKKKYSCYCVDEVGNPYDNEEIDSSSKKKALDKCNSYAFSNGSCTLNQK